MKEIQHKKNHAVGFYRYLFALVICLLHFRPADYDGPANAGFFGGYLAVEFFFLLSGWFLAAHIEKENAAGNTPDAYDRTWRYALQRLRRLWPPYFVALVAMALVRFFFVHDIYLKRAALALWEALMLQVWGFPWVLNVAFWYVSALFWASLIVYFLACKTGKAFRMVIAPVCCLVIFAAFFQGEGCLDFSLEYRFPVCLGMWRALAELMLGCLLYDIAQKWYGYTARWKSEKWLYTAAEAVFLPVILYVMYSTRHDIKDFFMVLLLSAFLVCVLSGKSLWSELLDNKLSEYLDGISYLVYLVQIPVIGLLQGPMHAIEPYPLRAALILLVVTLVAMAANAVGKAARRLLVRKQKATV